MERRKKGFTYLYSKELEQEIAYSDKTGKLFCKDGACYSAEELKILDDGGVSKKLHLLKKTFGGTIVDAQRYKKWTSKNTKAN